MTDYTTHYGLPFPDGADPVVVHTDLEGLAKKTDVELHKQQDLTEQKYGHLPAKVQSHGTAIGEHDAQLTNHEYRVSDHDRKLHQVRPSDDDSWRVRDQAGRVALEVDQVGSTLVGDIKFQSSHVPYRIRDNSGQVAFSIDADGRTFIGEYADGSASSHPSVLHVFMAAGQSNMSGRGRPVEGPQSARILQFGANRRVIEPAPLQLDMVDSPAGTSPALFFAHHYLATQPSTVGVLLVPVARGGTTFTGSPAEPSDIWTWVKDAAIDPEYALYNRSVQQTLEAIGAAEAEGYQVVLKGVLWHQGEGNSNTDPAQYATWLDDLIANYRADFAAPRLPVMIGQMCPEGIDRSTNRQRIDQVHQQTPYRVEYTGFAHAPYDAHLPDDTTHFSTKGTSYLGDAYATAYIQAVGNTHPMTV